MRIKFGLIPALGAPVLAVLAFEIILNAVAMFNHAIVHVPRRVDAVSRRLPLTPDMHGVHHSIVKAETAGDVGSSPSIRARLFDTCRGQPSAGPKGMTIGIPLFRHRRDLQADQVPLISFTNASGHGGVHGRTA